MRPTGPFFATPVGRRATSAGGHFCETKPIRNAADCLARRLSLCGLRPRAFAEAHSGATAVFVDEFYSAAISAEPTTDCRQLNWVRFVHGHLTAVVLGARRRKPRPNRTVL